VPKKQYAARNWYDAWLPDLAPSAALVTAARNTDSAAAWRAFVKRYRREMSRPEASRLLDLLAALSHHADFSVGCYCADESRCHRSILRQLFEERGAAIRRAR
jgi:uncharacterized protein YeaO (DUF488 family)